MIPLLSLFTTNVWGASVTLTLSDNSTDTWTNQGASGGGTAIAMYDKTVTGISLSGTSGYCRTSDNYTQIYSGSDITITSTVGNMTSVAFTCTGSNTNNYSPSKFALKSGSAGSYSQGASGAKVGTWTGNASTFTLHANAQVRVTQIVVTYTAAATPSITPSVSELDWGTVAKGASLTTKTFTITGTNLTSAALVYSASGGYSVSPSGKAGAAGALASQTLTVTPPSTATPGTYNSTVSITGGGLASAVTVNVKLKVENTDTFIDEVQSTSGYTSGSPHIEQGSYSTPSLSDKSVATSGTCEQLHYHFVGWITAAKYEAGTAIADGDLQSPTSATGATYYAVWAKQGVGGGSGYEYIGDDGLLEEDETYIFVSSKSAGTAYALKASDLPSSNNNSVTGVSVTVSSAGGKVTVATTNTNLEFTCTYHSGDWDDLEEVANSGRLLVINGNGIGYAGTGKSWYDADGLYGCNSKCNTYYGVYHDGTYFTSASGNSSRVYAFVKQSVSYTDYIAKCCTKLGSINGSMSLTQGGNSVTISGWSDVSNTGTYTVKMYKKNGASWDLVSGTASNGNAGTAGTRTNIATDSKSVTYTGLVVESEYKFTVQAIAGSASYCDGDETEVTTINSTSVSSTPFKFRYAIYIDDGTNDNYEYHYITPTGNTDEGSVDIDLNAHVDYYQFKIAGGFSGWWGQTGTDGKIEATTVSDWTLNGSYNVRLKTGAAGDYVFTVDYSGTTNPKVGVEYPSADQDAGYVIYYDNSILNWSSLYYRIGNNSNCSKVDAVLVTGTDKFYKITTPDYDNMDAWHIANNYGWTGSNSVYRTKTNSTPAEAAKAITNSISFQQYVVTGDITVIPTTTHSTGGDTGDAGNNNCEFYTINTPTSGMLTHTATITAPSNGTINLAYTNTSGTSCPTNTSTVSSLAHRTKLTATATPSTGYKVTAFTVTPSGDDAIDLSGDNGETDNHILAKDATFAATFSAKQSAITFDKNSGTGGSDGATGTYGSALPDITAPTRTGYSFGGYYDAETDNNGSGTQYYNANGKSAHNWDKDTEAASTLYANWSANTTTITLNANGGIENKEATIKYDAATYTTFTAVQKVGHTCNGYWTGSGGTGTKILNADGSFAGDNITVSTTVYTNGGKWAYTAASTLTLYAGWTNTYGGDEFELVLDLSELSAGKKIVILDKDYATAISTTQQSNNRASVAAGAADNAGFAMSEGNTVVTLGTATTVQVITLESTGTANRYYMNVENGYFYAPGTSTNYLLRTRANNSSYADQGQFNFALSNGDFTISAQSSTNKYLRKNTSSALFSCYANAGDQKAVLVYVKRESCDAPGTALSLSASSTNISTATGYNTSTLSTTGGNGGTVYYRVTSSNKANATIAGTSFSATAAGTYTVMAYQLKNGSKCRQISTVDITVTTPTLTVNKTSYDFGKKATGGTYTNSSITITGANLVGDISLSGVSGALSVSPTSVTAASAMAGAQTITITWEPTTAGALNQTLTFSSTGAADKTVTITGTGADYYNVTWNISGNDPIVVSVESGTKPTFPTPSPTSCDGTSTTFIGWTQTKWTGKLTQTQIDAKTAADVKVYKSSSDLPTVSAAIDYYAVWAKQEMESDEIVSSLTATALSGSNSTTWVTINSLDAPTTDATYKIYSMGTYKSGTNPKQYETYVMKWSSSNGYLQTNSVPSSGNKLLSVTVQTQTGIGNKSVGVSGSNNGSDWTSCGSLTATEAGGTYEFTSSYTWIKLTGAASSSLLESVTITYGSYSDYLTTCCESSGLEFSTTEQEVIREDLGGNKATHKVIYFPYTTSSGGTLSAEVKRMSTYGSRDEAAAGYSASTYTSVEVDETNNRVVLEVWSVNDPTTSGQWTYRVKLHQDATDALSGNYCATDDYSFVDVILRDKFVDAVNGNATINRDGKGVALNTPAESDMDVEKDDDCGGQTRRLLGWIRETDLETIYGSPGETGYLEGAAAYEANKDKIVAPGNGSFITTGCTWYAVWGVDNTPEP